MDTLLPHFPHLRRPPHHVVAGLRQVDPTADLVYLGWGKWLLVSVQPDRMDMWYKKRNGQFSTLRRDALEILVNARRLLALWETDHKYQANPGAFRRLIGRYDFAQLAVMAARPIAEYRIQGEPTSAIVDDFRRMDWLYRHTSDDELDRALDAPKEEQQAAAHAELTDPGRATDAWRYLFTRSHWYGDDRQRQRPRSGFHTIARIPA